MLLPKLISDGDGHFIFYFLIVSSDSTATKKRQKKVSPSGCTSKGKTNLFKI